MARLGELELDEADSKAAGNWKKFDCFVWHREGDPDDAERWAINCSSDSSTRSTLSASLARNRVDG